MSGNKTVVLNVRECEVIADGLQVRILKLLELQQSFRDASPYLAGMLTAVDSAAQELDFLRSLLKKVEA